MRTPATLSLARASASDRDIIDNYFDELESTLEANELLDKPCQIFNVDETGMPLDPKPLKIVTWKGHKNPSQVSSGVKSQITVVGCVSAGGQCLPPMVIWDRKNLPPELAMEEVPGTVYGLSSKGWIDQELFHLWFTKHFLLYAPPARPLLLLMDGHSSHYCPATIRYAAEERVILFSLPPNTTHLSQPLDKGIFGPLKVAWRQVCHEFLVKNPGAQVTKLNFSPLFSEAWVRALTPRNIISGFRTTGVYPPDRTAIRLPCEQMPNLAQKTGIAYIPLYTPAKRRISAIASASPKFSKEEHENFGKCYEAGANSDESRYQVWLKMYHPTCNSTLLSDSSLSDFLLPDSPLPDVYQPALKHSSIDCFLDCPDPPQRRPAVNDEHSIRVLTSSENLKRMEEKEKEKQRKAREKEERAKQRQAKKALKEQQKQQQQRPKRVCPQKKASSRITFSEEELAKFTRRYENGYDIATDERYNAWLQIFHPTEDKTSVPCKSHMHVPSNYKYK